MEPTEPAGSGESGDVSQQFAAEFGRKRSIAGPRNPPTASLASSIYRPEKKTPWSLTPVNTASGVSHRATHPSGFLMKSRVKSQESRRLRRVRGLHPRLARICGAADLWIPSLRVISIGSTKNLTHPRVSSSVSPVDHQPPWRNWLPSGRHA